MDYYTTVMCMELLHVLRMHSLRLAPQCPTFHYSAAAYQTNRSLFDKSTKIGTNIHYYTMNIFRY